MYTTMMYGMLLMVATGSGSCRKLVQVGLPENPLVAGMVFSNDSLASQAVTGVYVNILTNLRYFFNGAMSLYPGLSADELAKTSSLANEDQFYMNGLLPANQLITANLWKAAYAYIYQCNICLEGLQKSTGVSDDLKSRLTGEVVFVRALTYYYLVNLFGNVPLVVSTNAETNALLPRTEVLKVYQQIITDLQSAVLLLGNDAPNTYPSKQAAMALLARVYLYTQDWNKAETTASALITAGKYQLENSLPSVFLAGSRETIFQWAPVLSNINAPEGRIFVPASPAGKPAYVLTPGLLAAFETGDMRKTIWVKTVALSAQSYSYPFKYRINSSNSVKEYNIVLRLAEQYLIRAEARARQNNIVQAVDDINIIRARAGLAGLSAAMDQQQCLSAILQERRTELFAEWGHRWFDLKRMGVINGVLGAAKGADWQQTDALYPIPATELDADPNLDQNDGYD